MCRKPSWLFDSPVRILIAPVKDEKIVLDANIIPANTKIIVGLMLKEFALLYSCLLATQSDSNNVADSVTGNL